MRRIAYILGGFPQDTQPFVYKEIEELVRLGQDLRVVSLHPIGPNLNQLDYVKWLAKTCYAGSLHPIGMLRRHMRCAAAVPGKYINMVLNYKAYGGKRVYWGAPHVARYLTKEGISQMHAHFAWSAADLARAVSKLTGIPYTLTAHQSDIHRYPDRLEEKLRDAAAVLTCTKGNAEFLKEKYPESVTGKIETVYHGVDVDQFIPHPANNHKTIDILSVGSLIKAKGFIYLVDALSTLAKRGVKPRTLIVGDGSEKNSIEKAIQRAGLTASTEIIERMAQSKLIELYSQAKLLVLPCIVIDDAPHGIPNVLAEAMAMGLPVVSSDVPQIPELIENGKDGILVGEKDSESLAVAIEDLLNDRNKRDAIGKKARKKIEDKFNSREHIRRLRDIFGEIDL